MLMNVRISFSSNKNKYIRLTSVLQPLSYYVKGTVAIVAAMSKSEWRLRLVSGCF